MSDYEKAAAKYVRGEVTFDQMIKESRNEIAHWAAALTRNVPAHWGFEDTRQVLLVELWRALTRFDPAKAGRCEPGPFARRAAKQAAFKAAQRARGVADRHNWRGPANYEIPASCFEVEPDVRLEATQEETAVRSCELAAMFPPGERLVAFAFAARGGNVRQAAEALYADPHARHVLRLGCESAAEELASSWADNVMARGAA